MANEPKLHVIHSDPDQFRMITDMNARDGKRTKKDVSDGAPGDRHPDRFAPKAS